MRRSDFLTAAAIAAAVFFVYARALSAFFFEDDFQLLVGAWHFDPATLLQHRPRYRPVFETYFWVGSAVFGRSTAAFHAASILLHVLNGWLILALSRRVGLPPLFAGLAAMLFVVQPAHVAAVAWVGAIAESFVVLFGCASVLLLLTFRRSGRWIWLVTAIAAFALALLSHESGVVFLPLLAIIDAVVQGRAWRLREAVRVHWPFALITALYLTMTFTAATGDFLDDEISYRAGPHVLTNVLDYIAAIYVGDRKVQSHVLVVLVLAAVLWKGTPRARLGVVWLIAGILPFAPFDTGILSRYTYIPAIGLALLLAEGLRVVHERLSRRSIALAHAGVLVMALLLSLRFAYFARDGVKDVHAAAEEYRVFLQEVRQDHPQLQAGQRITVARDRIGKLNPPFVEAAVQWEYLDSTIRVHVQ